MDVFVSERMEKKEWKECNKLQAKLKFPTSLAQSVFLYTLRYILVFSLLKFS